MLNVTIAKLEKRRLDRQHSALSEHQGAGDNCDGNLDDDFQPFKYQQVSQFRLPHCFTCSVTNKA